MRTGPQWLQLFRRRLEQWNVTVELGTDEAVRMCRGDAEGVTWWGDGAGTIFFASIEPGISVVLEEIAHVLQARRSDFVDRDAREMQHLREIDAKACLVEKRDRLGIPEHEDRLTRDQLALERDVVRRLEERFR